MLEIVLTREDANTEFALLAEWLVEDRAEVQQGQPVCVVETTKATVEIEAPGAGTIVQLYEEGVEVELGKTVARIAENAEELDSLDQDAERETTAPKPSPTERKATRKAAELAERHGVDLAAIEKRGFITEKDVEELIARQKATASPGGESALAGLSTENVSLPASFDLDESTGALDPTFFERLRSDSNSFRLLPPDEKIAILRQYGAQIGVGRRPRRGLADSGAAGRHRGRCRDRPAGNDPLRGNGGNWRIEPVRRGSGDSLPARVPRCGNLGGQVDPVRRWRSS